MREVSAITTTWYAHGFLWKAARHHLALAGRTEEGQYYTAMSACLFAYLTVEAHINHVGRVLFPQAWENERRFEHVGVRGMAGKIRFLDENLSAGTLEAGVLERIAELRDLRDQLSHGKSVVVVRRVEHAAGELPAREDAGPPITLERAVQGVADVTTYCTYWHLRALRAAGSRDQVYALGPTFDALLSEGSRTTGPA